MHVLSGKRAHEIDAMLKFCCPCPNAVTQCRGHPCVSHGVLDQDWRSVNNTKGTDKNGKIHCDKAGWTDINFPGWFRFKGNAGNRMLDKCPEPFTCGTNAPMWLNGKHPAIGDGVVSRKTCVSHHNGCCSLSFPVLVKMCSAGFYVYLLQNAPRCFMAYCGEYHDLCFDENGGCSHYCYIDKTTLKPACSCPSGFPLGKDRRTCEYRDLCLDNNGRCSDNCSMDNSTFKAVCSCPKGFRLGKDQRTCEFHNLCLENNGGCSDNCSMDNSTFTVVCSCPKGFVVGSNKLACNNSCFKSFLRFHFS
ncbi:oncoprotein-induced transcript 3 protein-like [Lingula anatina]|uniref:Oncoprotein-induced transcript 3 protein-like n=1 Tax=Lingula anatina TaxID=7574 RepID=A0A1S3HUR9_LINAN|nr:oncoprotein-induced transcript 3 protein-like [Lingula anatina]|eukprot:XP_013389763.1 oncoprotein-induced transcript 3 protein-like [Lingula anatina]